jgi:hypothetical protein
MNQYIYIKFIYDQRVFNEKLVIKYIITQQCNNTQYYINN